MQVAEESFSAIRIIALKLFSKSVCGNDLKGGVVLKQEKRIPRELITPDVMLMALAGVTQGQTFDLAEEI